jgi:diketogulonate reductase-like aldo/keto reductase
MYTLQLNDGSNIPGIALGLYLVKDGDETENIVRAALDIGYRHFDGASFYYNEGSFGKAIRSSNIPREEIFYTTKVWTTDKTHDDTVRSIERTVSEIGFSPDLALVHWPVPVDLSNNSGHIEMYRGLQTCVSRGLVKRIGLSNYTPQDYEELMNSGIVTIPPVVNQIEISPLAYRKETITYFEDKGILLQSFKPLMRGELLSNQIITDMAHSLDISPAAIALKWNKQKGFNILCKSLQITHLQENFDIINNDSYEPLSDEHMNILDNLTSQETLDTLKSHYEKRRFGTPAPWGNMPYAQANRL